MVIITIIAIYKLGDVGISSNLTNDNVHRTSREVDNETMAAVKSRFAEVTDNHIVRMQDIIIPNDTK